MGGTPFLKKFETFDAARRARIILGMDRQRRIFMEQNGGRKHVLHDISEYLLDNKTISAYLAAVRALENPELMRAAFAEAGRARVRISAAKQPQIVQNPSRNMRTSILPTYRGSLTDVKRPAKTELLWNSNRLTKSQWLGVSEQKQKMTVAARQVPEKSIWANLR